VVDGPIILAMMSNSIVDDVGSKGHILLRFLASRFNNYWHLCALECWKGFCTLMDCCMPLNVHTIPHNQTIHYVLMLCFEQGCPSQMLSFFFPHHSLNIKLEIHYNHMVPWPVPSNFLQDLIKITL
jgi:hypothetical protein